MSELQRRRIVAFRKGHRIFRRDTVRITQQVQCGIVGIDSTSVLTLQKVKIVLPHIKLQQNNVRSSNELFNASLKYYRNILL